MDPFNHRAQHPIALARSHPTSLPRFSPPADSRRLFLTFDLSSIFRFPIPGPRDVMDKVVRRIYIHSYLHTHKPYRTYSYATTKNLLREAYDNNTRPTDRPSGETNAWKSGVAASFQLILRSAARAKIGVQKLNSVSVGSYYNVRRRRRQLSPLCAWVGE